MPKPRKPSGAQAWAQGLAPKKIPTHRGAKVETISSLDEVNYAGPYMIMQNGEQPTAKDIANFNGKIYVLRAEATEQALEAFMDKLDDQYALKSPAFAAYREERRAREALEKKSNQSKKEEAKAAVEPRIEPNPAESGDYAAKAVKEVEPKEAVEPGIEPKIEPNPAESGDCAPKAEGSSANPNPTDKHAKHANPTDKHAKHANPSKKYAERNPHYEEMSALCTAVLRAGAARAIPGAPDRAVIVSGTFYLLHRAASEEAVDELGRQIEKLLQLLYAAQFDRERVLAARATVLSRLAPISRVIDGGVDPLANEEKVGNNDVFIAIIRCTAEPPKRAAMKSEEEELAANLTARLLSDGPHQTVQLHFAGRAFILHPGARKADIDAFTTSYIAYNGEFNGDYIYGRPTEPEWSGVIAKLAVFADEVLNPNFDDWKPPYRMDPAAFTVLYNDKAVPAVAQSIPDVPTVDAKSGRVEPEKEVESNEDEEYEEVDNFNPHDIKCKCVIS